MTASPAALTRLDTDAVAALHGAFIARLRQEVQTAANLANKNDPATAGAALDYLLTLHRYRQTAAPGTLAKLMTEGPAALSAAATAAQHVRFQPAQQEALDKAARTRREPPVVTRIFGNDDVIYLRPMDAGDTTTERAVTAFLHARNLQIDSYKDGYATDAAGKQRFKIGKLLQSSGEEGLYKDFRDDERRVLDHLLVAISRKPEHIARMSEGRGWVSCMSPHKAEFSFMAQEIAQGSLVAYLVSENDPEINNPLARTVIRPYQKVEPEIEAYKAYAGIGNSYHRMRAPLKCAFEKFKLDAKWALQGRPAGEHDVLYIAETKAYGLSHGALQLTVDTFTRQHLNHGISSGDYHLSALLYTDTLPRDAHFDGKTAKTIADTSPEPFI